MRYINVLNKNKLKERTRKKINTMSQKNFEIYTILLGLNKSITFFEDGQTLYRQLYIKLNEIDILVAMSIRSRQKVCVIKIIHNETKKS